MTFLNTLITAIVLFLPAGISNVTPVFASKIGFFDFLDKPIDRGRTFRHKRILGDHKTVRGFIVGIGVSAVLSGGLYYLMNSQTRADTAGEITSTIVSVLLNSPLASILNQAFYTFGISTHSAIFQLSVFVTYSTLLAFAALAGDSVKSFFKRQVGVPSGKSWIPFDQIDYVLAGILAIWLMLRPDFAVLLTMFVFWSLIHPVSTAIGWLIGVKDEPI